MYTSLALVSFAALIGAEPQAKGPDWKTDYRAAVQEGQKERKPLAVFVGSGPEGYQKVVRFGALTPSLEKILAGHYVCVYLDTSKPDGQRFARQVRLPNGGLVLSDRSGLFQAFRHDGALYPWDLKRHLLKHSGRNSRTGTYGAQAASNAAPRRVVTPQFYGGGFGGFGGGGGGC